MKEQDADKFPPFKEFMDSMKQRLNEEGKNAFLWCQTVQLLGYFPILFGGATMGVLAVQSRSGDFFL